ncbi:OmpA family protein [Roseicyclus sp. F158]|uniref:OmpA family protein n=1 Tax=Tropicimonas omnivorans TaxID=3075590 RepID=A0ABU3DI03_9RHOB|nr:OmpA family protein [Roseicyclus sp. F158]MDT0683174.1 OmpA family protein [Roseicyclus sp. F158]
MSLTRLISTALLALGPLPSIASDALSAQDCAALWQAYGVAHASCREALGGQKAHPPVAEAAPETAPLATSTPPVAPGRLTRQERQDNLVFSAGNAVIDEGMSDQLDRLAGALETPPLAEACLRLVGHANRTAGDDRAANVRLAQERAEAVAEAIRARLSKPGRIREITNVGDHQPLPGRPVSAPLNRRVTIYARRCP